MHVILLLPRSSRNFQVPKALGIILAELDPKERHSEVRATGQSLQILKSEVCIVPLLIRFAKVRLLDLAPQMGVQKYALNRSLAPRYTPQLRKSLGLFFLSDQGGPLADHKC